MSESPHNEGSTGSREDDYPGPLSRPSTLRSRSGGGVANRGPSDLNLISPWDMTAISGGGQPSRGGPPPHDHDRPRVRQSVVDQPRQRQSVMRPPRSRSDNRISHHRLPNEPRGSASSGLSADRMSGSPAHRLSEYSRQGGRPSDAGFGGGFGGRDSMMRGRDSMMRGRDSMYGGHRDSMAQVHSALLSKRAAYSLRRQSLRKSASLRNLGGGAQGRKSSKFLTGISRLSLVPNFGRPSIVGAGNVRPLEGDSIHESTSLLPMQKEVMVEEDAVIDDEEESASEEDDEFESSHQSSPHGSERSASKEDYEYDEYEESTLEALRDIISGNSSSVLLLLLPPAWLAHLLQWSVGWVFWLNFLAMIPLAAIMGDFTEEVAMNTNATVGGMVNALFGKSVEIVFGVQAIMANELRVVQSTMIGTVFSNLLLVLGSCFLFGGMKFREQQFNSTAANANMGLLALSSIALVLPTPFAQYYEVQDDRVLTISRIASVFLIFMYAQLLIFQLRTHSYLFDDGGGGGSNYVDDVENTEIVENNAIYYEEEEEQEQEEFDAEFEDSARISMAVAVSGFLAATLCLIVCSSYLIDSLDGCCGDSDVGRTFIGLVILPIVGNAVEHSYAVTVAMEDKLDLAMGVAVGSCLQISLYAAPLTVLVGWFFDKNMTLNFPHFEIYLYIMSIVTVAIVLSNPTAVWLEGSLLITTYLMIAVGFYFEKVKDF